MYDNGVCALSGVCMKWSVGLSMSYPSSLPDEAWPFSVVILYTTLQGVYMVVHGSISCQLLRYDFCMHTWTVVIMFLRFKQ